jgi:polyadenylate-binding protein
MNAATTPYASASLYVGDLHTEVTEALLCDIFNAVGPVASIRVCRDAVTRRSLGYAYVNFHMMVDAERALDTMNYTMIKGRPIRIMWSHRDPSIRKSGKGNIFIKNLDKSIDNKMLYDTFCTFGNILSCKIAYDEEGRSKGYGFVHYETEEAAETAIEKVDGKMLKEKIVYVGKFKRKADRDLEEGSSEKKFTNIFVKNLDETVTEEDMREQFGAFGEITSLALMSEDGGKSKGFCFINFETMEAAAKSVDEKNGFEFKTKAMYVGRAQKKSERQAELKDKFDKIKQERISKYQGVNLYVKNLDETLADDIFRTAFEEYGQITSCKIMRDDKGMGKGFGFVCYTTPEEATKAVTEMNGKILASKPIYVALAQRKEQRRAQLESQMAQRVQQSRMQNQPAGGMPGMYPPQGPAVFYPMQAGRGQMYYQPQMGANGAPRRFPQQGGKGGQQFQQGGPQGYMVQGPQAGRQPRQNNQRNQRPGQPQGQKGGAKGGKGAAQGGKGGPQFQQGARNVPPAPAPAPPAAAPAAPAQAAAPGPQDFAAQLAAVPAEQQKMMLGERLFPLIEKHSEVGEQAGKITGMLLDMDTPELLHLIESPEALREKVVEAINVLAQHGMANPIAQ